MISLITYRHLQLIADICKCGLDVNITDISNQIADICNLNTDIYTVSQKRRHYTFVHVFHRRTQF